MCLHAHAHATKYRAKLGGNGGKSLPLYLNRAIAVCGFMHNMFFQAPPPPRADTSCKIAVAAASKP